MSLYDPSAKYAIQEDDGLQVAHEHVLPQALPHDHEGLQRHDAASRMSTRSDTSKEALVNTVPAGDDERPESWARRNRKRLLVAGAVLAVLGFLAAILGGVLGSKSMQNRDQGASTTPNDNTASSSRIRSTKGVWNGTAIATTYVKDAKTVNFILLYQDYTGAIVQQMFKWHGGKTQYLSFDFGSSHIPFDAANGTAIALDGYLVGGGSTTYHAVYVARNGTLADAFLTNSDLSADGAFIGAWTPGDLASQRILAAPLTDRPALELRADKGWYGKGWGTWGARLFFGGSDGRLYQHSYDWQSRSWAATPPKPLGFGSAYGGVAVRVGQDIPGGTVNTTVYAVSQQGTLQSAQQVSHASANNDTMWPAGPDWTDPLDSAVKVAANSSLGANWQNAPGSYVFFPDGRGQVNTQVALPWERGPAQWSTPALTSNRTVIMPGSGMDVEGAEGYSLILFQDQGDQIAYSITYGRLTNTQGHVVPMDS